MGWLKSTRLFSGLIILSSILTFIFAAHVITISSGASSFNFNEDSNAARYNITIANTNGGSFNITQVNITLPSSFTFIANTNISTNITALLKTSFVNTSTILSWTNASGIVFSNSSNGNGNVTYFLFNASAATPGNYNITIVTVNATGTNTTLLAVIINDTTVPVIVTTNITPVNGANVSDTISLQVNVSDNGVMQAVFFNFTNTTGTQVGIARATNPSENSWNSTFNTSTLSEGYYNVSVFANDTYNNLNSTTKVQILIDNTDPSPSLSKTSSTQTRIFISSGCSDALSGVSGCSVSTSSGEVFSSEEIRGLACGNTYTITLTGTDYAGNTASSAQSFSTDTCTSSGGSSGGSSSSTSASWSKTIVEPSAPQLNTPITKQLGSKTRVKLKIAGQDHHVGVKTINGNNVVIEVASTPQEVTLTPGTSKKFDVTADGRYDLLVTLVSVSGTIADVRITAIDEAIPSGSSVTTTPESTTPLDTTPSTPDTEKSSKMWIVTIIVVLLIVAGLVWFMTRKDNKTPKLKRTR